MRRALLAVTSVALVWGALACNSETPLVSGATAGTATSTATTAPVDCKPVRDVIGPQFGSHSFEYASGTALPSMAVAERDAATKAFYAKWKAAYFRTASCGAYIDTGGGTGAAGDTVTVSEGHGYGMMLTVLMASDDLDTQPDFDALYTYYRAFPASKHPELMAWAQAADCTAGESDSATDGDLDIAMALLYADRVWGSGGDIDYFGAATNLISAIKRAEFNTTTHLPRLGNAADRTDESTRPSDFMIDHFRAFQAKTCDADWGASVDSVLTLTEEMTAKFSPNAGLLPDFVVNAATDPAPAAADEFESGLDGGYGSNSCRVPWHFGTDWVVSGDARTKTALQRINSWIQADSGGSVDNIRAGYLLDGSRTGRGDYFAWSFIAPFGVAAMADASNQAWLDTIWERMANDQETSLYFDDSIRLFAMLVMSGNWWQP